MFKEHRHVYHSTLGLRVMKKGADPFARGVEDRNLSYLVRERERDSERERKSGGGRADPFARGVADGRPRNLFHLVWTVLCATRTLLLVNLY